MTPANASNHKKKKTPDTGLINHTDTTPSPGRCNKHGYRIPGRSSRALDGNTASEGLLPLSPSFRSTTDPPALTVSFKLTPELPVPLPCSGQLRVRAVLCLYVILLSCPPDFPLCHDSTTYIHVYNV